MVLKGVNNNGQNQQPTDETLSLLKTNTITQSGYHMILSWWLILSSFIYFRNVT